MRSKNLIDFYELVRTDESLQDQFKTITDGNQFADTAVRLGSERGFQFSPDDVKVSIDILVSRTSELSEAELSTVAGGGALPIRFSGDCTLEVGKGLSIKCGGGVPGMTTMFCTATGGGGNTTGLCTGDPPNC